MNLTLLGAAGATGVPLVEQALAEGHHVTALVRSRQKGDATDRVAVSGP